MRTQNKNPLIGQQVLDTLENLSYFLMCTGGALAARYNDPGIELLTSTCVEAMKFELDLLQRERSEIQTGERA